jgi:hypothetical protein
MNNATELDRANKAKSVLDSPAYQDAYKAVREALIAGMEACPMADTAKAEDFRRCLKLLHSLQINMAAAVNSGKLAQFRLNQEEAAKKNPFRNIFRDKS